MSEKATDTPERSQRAERPERSERPGRQEPSGLLLRHPDGSSFRFDPGALCLELLPTGGPGPLAYFEVLHEPADLVRWAEESRLPDGLGPGDGPGSGPGPALVVSAGEVADARDLRDALWRLAEGHVEGAPPGPDDLATLNDAAAHPPLVARLTAGGDREWAPGVPGPGCCPPSLAMRSSCSPGRSPTGSVRAARTAAACCSSTPPAPEGGAGARWSAAATATRSGPTVPGSPPPTSEEGSASVTWSAPTVSVHGARKSVFARVDIGGCCGYGFSRSPERQQGPAETNCRAAVQAVAVRRTVRWWSFEARVVAGRRRGWRPHRVARSDQGPPSAGPRFTREQYPQTQYPAVK